MLLSFTLQMLKSLISSFYLLEVGWKKKLVIIPKPIEIAFVASKWIFLKQDVGLTVKQLLCNKRKQKLIRDLAKERLLVLHTQSKLAGFRRAHFDLFQTNYCSVVWLFCALVALHTKPKLLWYTAVIQMKIWHSVNKAWQGSFFQHNKCIIQF